MAHVTIAVRTLTTPTPDFSAFTYPRLARFLDEPRPSILAVGAFVDDEPAGLALGELGSGEGWLLSLMVDKQFRGEGIASQLLRSFVSESAGRGIGRLEARYPERLASRPVLEAVLARAGWSEPSLSSVQLVGLAGAMAAEGGRWPGVRRLRERPGPYAFTPWSERSAEDDVSVSRLLAEQSAIHPPDPRAFVRNCEPELSFALRRGGELIGWLVGVRDEGGFGPGTTGGGAAAVHYPAAYCADAHSRSGILIAGYHRAFSRQAELFGPLSRASYRTHPGARAMLALTLRRFAPMALRVDRVLSSQRVVPAALEGVA